MITIKIINGPNMNLLGTRQKKIYGHTTLKQIITTLKTKFTNQAKISHTQSNSEHTLIKTIHKTKAKYLILNAAAFSYYSIAILDALLAKTIPFIEVHMSNIYKREKLRHHSLLTKYALGSIIGLGHLVYQTAIHYIIDLNHTNTQSSINNTPRL